MTVQKDFSMVYDVFPEKYCNLLQKYIDRMDGLFVRYDVVIFMARKAFCFYQALIKNNLITQNTNCIVLSSRALDYNISGMLRGKRIALVDDVVVKGNTLEAAFRALTIMKADEHLDVYIAACCDVTAQREDMLYKQSLMGPYIHLSESAIYELTGHIASFINRSAISYNVDEPRCFFSFDDEDELWQFMRQIIKPITEIRFYYVEKLLNHHYFLRAIIQKLCIWKLRESMKSTS